MGKALYRKYRSKSLDEVVGQRHVTDILTRSLAAGKLSHAYLLTGPAGVGKTSIARILAYEINKLPYSEDTTNLDIIEIDAASNNGVENIRDLIERVQVAPVAADKKIYIIDEVHMLSKSAFNALLKTLEEPPEHAVFILATTDVDKLPPTIVSRTQRFSFRAIASSDAVNHLKYIAAQEKITIDDDALQLIAERGEGSFRNSISLLDQMQNITDATTGITRQLIEQSLGLAPVELVNRLLAAYTAKDLKTIIALLDESDQSGIQPTVITSQLIQTARSRIADTPQLLPLLDQLLDVAKSSQPNIKLLTVLAAHAAPKPKTVALDVTTPAVTAPIKELEALATQPQHTTTNHAARPERAPARPAVTATDTVLPPSDGSKLDDHAARKGPDPLSDVAGPSKSEGSSPTSDQTKRNDDRQATDGNIAVLDWDQLIEYTRVNYVAIYSVLKKCSHAQEGNIITLYTGTLFWKRKLDDAKHRVNLVDAMEKVGAIDLTIETIGSPPPPKDDLAASVAAIMGGGEEVTL